jgi:hypothetical protein
VSALQNPDIWTVCCVLKRRFYTMYKQLQ